MCDIYDNIMDIYFNVYDSIYIYIIIYIICIIIIIYNTIYIYICMYVYIYIYTRCRPYHPASPTWGGYPVRGNNRYNTVHSGLEKINLLLGHKWSEMYSIASWLRHDLWDSSWQLSASKLHFVARPSSAPSAFIFEFHRQDHPACAWLWSYRAFVSGRL